MSREQDRELLEAHCCDNCCRRQGLDPKYPPDSGVSSWLCDICGHYGIGSAERIEAGDWLIKKIVRAAAAMSEGQ
jgi:hypothetical protein